MFDMHEYCVVPESVSNTARLALVEYRSKFGSRNTPDTQRANRLAYRGKVATSDIKAIPRAHELADNVVDPDVSNLMCRMHGGEAGHAWAGEMLGYLESRNTETLQLIAFDPQAEYYGLIDPEEEDMVICAVLCCKPDGSMFSWLNRMWDPVPPTNEPDGMDYIQLNPGQLSQIMQYPGVITAAAAPKPNRYFALLDSADPNSIITVFRVDPETKTIARRLAGQWIKDSKLYAALVGPNPPSSDVLKPEEVNDIIDQIDAYDKEHPNELDDDVVVAAGNPPARSLMPRQLLHHWVRGPGSLKIRWGVAGDFNRCRRNLKKYVPATMLNGACSNLHRLKTGRWPGKGRVH